MSRLTEEMVIARSKQSDIGLVKKLNCWGSDLTDVSIIRRMHGVEVLALSVNKINTLAPFEDCKNLQELYLRKNNIQDIGDIVHLQNLPELKYLWLAENPCCDHAGPNYRKIVLRALPQLKKLDNIDVTQEEVEDALRDGDNMRQISRDPQLFEESFEVQQPQAQSHHNYPAQSAHQQISPQQKQQMIQQQQQQQQAAHHQLPSNQWNQARRSMASPSKEQSQSPQSPSANSETNSAGSQNQPSSKPSSPLKDFAEPLSPQYNNISRESRPVSFHQQDCSPGSDQENQNTAYRERSAPIPPSASAQSMKDYYQNDRQPHPVHYRHSQSDLTDWEEHQQQQHAPQNQYGSQMQLHQAHRRSIGLDREPLERYAYRNGSARENGDWEDTTERPRLRRPESRYSEMPSALLHNYGGPHRRPVNRNSNLLSATLCLVKELDYTSLEVVEHAVRCRIDELTAE